MHSLVILKETSEMSWKFPFEGLKVDFKKSLKSARLETLENL